MQIKIYGLLYYVLINRVQKFKCKSAMNYAYIFTTILNAFTI